MTFSKEFVVTGVTPRIIKAAYVEEGLLTVTVTPEGMSTVGSAVSNEGRITLLITQVRRESALCFTFEAECTLFLPPKGCTLPTDPSKLMVDGYISEDGKAMLTVCLKAPAITKKLVDLDEEGLKTAIVDLLPNNLQLVAHSFMVAYRDYTSAGGKHSVNLNFHIGEHTLYLFGKENGWRISKSTILGL